MCTAKTGMAVTLDEAVVHVFELFRSQALDQPVKP